MGSSKPSASHPDSRGVFWRFFLESSHVCLVDPANVPSFSFVTFQVSSLPSVVECTSQHHGPWRKYVEGSCSSLDRSPWRSLGLALKEKRAKPDTFNHIFKYPPSFNRKMNCQLSKWLKRREVIVIHSLTVAVWQIHLKSKFLAFNTHLQKAKSKNITLTSRTKTERWPVRVHPDVVHHTHLCEESRSSYIDKNHTAAIHEHHLHLILRRLCWKEAMLFDLQHR